MIANKVNTVLFGVMVVLFLIFFGELFYLFLYTPSKKAPNLTLPTPTSKPRVVKTPSSSSLSQTDLEKLPLKAINLEAFTQLLALRKDILQSVSVEQTLEGVIVNIEYEPGAFEDGTVFERKLTIKGSQGTLYMQFFTLSDTNRLEVLELKDGVIKTIKFDNLSLNEKVTLKQIFDPTKYLNSSTTNFTRFIITRVQ